jgi:predicted RNase H-like nuclease (RuvC/YqgF family)
VDTTQEKEFFDTFYRGLNMNTNYHKELNNERTIIKNLQDDIMKLHGYYRMKLHTQKVEFENELDQLRKNLSNNKDLWDKLAIAERNEAILKEELAKTQKSLAAAEEFIKRLRIQIRNSHDKNVMLEKKLSESSVKETINQGGKGTNLKAMELYSDIRQNYVYNMKNNVNIITALDNIKTKYGEDENIKIILNNFEMLHKKYSEEVDNKRSFVTTLSNIKEDVEKMQMLHNKKIEEFGRENSMLKEENTNLKIELEKLKIKTNNSHLASSRKINKSTNIDISKMNNSQGKGKKTINNNNISNLSKSEKFPSITQSRKITEEKKLGANNNK